MAYLGKFKGREVVDAAAVKIEVSRAESFEDMVSGVEETLVETQPV